jgi:FMN phosphatase YigB (HAD superfamily)
MAKRGRPKKQKIDKDLGTEELQMHRHKDFLNHIEPIDFLIQEKMINFEQHKAGLRLRWLYTLSYGAASVQAVRYMYPEDFSNAHSEEWHVRKRKEYVEVMDMLKKNKCDKEIIALCIMNEYNPKDLQKIKDGLGIISNFISKKRLQSA